MVNANSTKNFYSAFDLVEQRSGRDALEVFAYYASIRSKSSSCGWFKLPSTSEVRPERRTRITLVS